MKDSNEVIHEFNEIVNMTALELEKWLKSDDSQSAGWPKEDENGETVGHDSGRNIVEILKANPNKDPENYTDEQIQHMRKVVSYCKRHLAQEEKTNAKKSDEEVQKTKSYASLKNWGHDVLKKRHAEDGQTNGETTHCGGEEEEEGQQEKQAGDKRKKVPDEPSGANKKRETRKGEGVVDSDEEDDDDDDDDDFEEDTDDDEEEQEEEDNIDESEDVDDQSAKPKKGPKPGDTVSWNWGNGQPKGKVLDVKGEKTSITTKRGNEVTRDGDPEDPAVVLDTGKSKAVKANHELN